MTKLKNPKWNIIKEIIVQPYLSTLKYQLLHTATNNITDDTKEKLIDICYMLSPNSNSTFSLFHVIQTYIHTNLLYNFYYYTSTTTNRYHPQRVNYLIPLMQPCADCIMELVFH